MATNYNDTVLHVNKNGDDEVCFPITRYDNILSAPKVIVSTENVFGSPFHILKDDEIDMSIEQIKALFSNPQNIIL